MYYIQVRVSFENLCLRSCGAVRACPPHFNRRGERRARRRGGPCVAIQANDVRVVLQGARERVL